MIALAAALLLLSEPNPEAVRLERKATVEYNAGEFGQAFLDYQATYDLVPVPELLFDMAQCQRGLHHWERAAFLYKRYLAAKPQARNRAKVEELMAQVEQQKQSEQARPETAEHPAEAAAPPTAAAPPSPPPPAAAQPAPAVAPPVAEQPAADNLGLVPPPQVVAQPEPAHSHGLPALTWITGGVGAVCLLGAGGLGIAVLAQPDMATIDTAGNISHTLTYQQLSTINVEGSVSVGLAIGGVVLLGAATLYALVAQ